MNLASRSLLRPLQLRTPFLRTLITALFWLTIFTPLCLRIAAAHEIKPIVIDASLQNNTSLRWVMRLNLEASLAGIDAKHDDTDDDPNTQTYKRLRALKATQLEHEFKERSAQWSAGFVILDDTGTPLPSEVVSAIVATSNDDTVPRDTLVTVVTDFPKASASWTWQWKNSYAPTIVRYNDLEDSAQNVAHFVNAGEASPKISVREPQIETPPRVTFLNFIKLGFVHILPKGLDHIVFVLGIVLLLPQLKPVALQITLFTIAHSITLGLAVFGTLALPATLVESCIALSIVYIGFDNLRPQAIGILRKVFVFGFGLLHGLGFANVLSELNTNNSHPLVSLAGFNVGVELGQLLVVVLFFLVIGLWTRNRPWYGKIVRIPLSLALSVVGLWWFFERIT